MLVPNSNLDSTAAYIKKTKTWKKIYHPQNIFFYLFSMQLFSADATIFSKKKSHENIKKVSSKVAHNWPQIFFSCTGPAAQTSLESIFHVININMSQDSSFVLSVPDPNMSHTWSELEFWGFRVGFRVNFKKIYDFFLSDLQHSNCQKRFGYPTWIELVKWRNYQFLPQYDNGAKQGKWQLA